MAPDSAPELIARAVAGSGSGMTIADATVEGFPLTYVNAAFERLTGYTSAECLGRSCSFLQGRDTDRLAVARVREALREGRDVRSVLLNNKRDGTPFYNELRISHVRDRDGRVVQVIGVQHDVSGLVTAQRTLEGERDRARSELAVLREALTSAAVDSRPHLDLATALVAAEDGVAGDFFLVAAGPRDTTILVVGDAMGHGVTAAQQATYVRASLANSARFTHDPLQLLDLANQALIEHAGTAAEFVTAVCASFDPHTHTLRWASAGHPVPLSLQDGQPIGPNHVVGTALGVTLDFGGRISTMRLGAGEGVLLFTDGLPDARSSDRRYVSSSRFGDERARRFVRQRPAEAPHAFVKALHAAVHEYSDGRFSDDLCLLAARAS